MKLNSRPESRPSAGSHGEQRQVGVDPRGDRVVVAGAEVAVGAQAVALAPHHHRQLGVGLVLHEAEDDVTPARSRSRAHFRLASSSKRALISTSAVTFLPFSAASIRAATIGLSLEVR